MSKKSISPIPTQESSGETPSPGFSSNLSPNLNETPGVGSMPVPDLSTIRRNWARQLQGLPSLPRETAPGSSSTTATNPARNKNSIPELPSMGAMASKAVLAMEGHADLFSDDSPTAPSSAPPLTKPLPSFPAFTRQPEQVTDQVPKHVPQQAGRPHHPQSPTPNTPQIRNTPPQPPQVTTAETVNKPAKETISAMPTMAEPDISIPLVREKIASVDPTTAKATEEPVTPFGELPVNKETAHSTPTPQPTPEETPVFKRVTSTHPTTASTRPASIPEYTDQDLQEALQPFISPTVDKFLYTPTHGIHTYLEPMLRSTVRRAIAEQMEDASPFREVSGWDKFAWKMRALIGSRTYEDIVFSHTKRYQVEEVFLLRPKSRSLISYASHDPSRHAKPGKVQDTVKKIAAKTADKDQPNKCVIEWDNSRNLMIRKGEHCLLAAIVHGPSNAILRADLDYALRQAEERFGKTLEEESDIHVQILQPLLEGCLLIQAPAIPN